MTRLRPARSVVFASSLLFAALSPSLRCEASQVAPLTRENRLKLYEYVLPLASHIVVATVVDRAVLPPPRGSRPVMPSIQFTFHVDDYVRGDSIANDEFLMLGSDIGFESILVPGVKAVLTMQQLGAQFSDISALGATVRGDTAFVYNPSYATEWSSLRDSLANAPSALRVSAALRHSEVAILGHVVDAQSARKQYPWTWTGSFLLRVQHGYLSEHPPEPDSELNVQIQGPMSYLEHGVVPPMSVGDTILVALVRSDAHWELAKGVQAVWRVRGDSISADLQGHRMWVAGRKQPLSPVLEELR